jgi:hypothetical protein
MKLFTIHTNVGSIQLTLKQILQLMDVQSIPIQQQSDKVWIFIPQQLFSINEDDWQEIRELVREEKIDTLLEK